MKFTRLAAATLLAIAAVPAAAKDEEPVNLAIGTVIYAPDGTAVGTIQQVSSSAVVVHTGSHVATVGIESFVTGKLGTTIGYTKAQLDAAVDANERDRVARLAAALQVGARLRSNDGFVVGAIQAINPDGSVIVIDEERAFRLERNQLNTDAQGVVLLFSAAQLKAALGIVGG